MRKKDIFWIVLLLILGGVYYHFFSHSFDKEEIGITASIRPGRRHGAVGFPVTFTLNNAYSLTSLEVFPMEGDKFDPLATPVWHLVSDSNSVPMRAFGYGQQIRGMKPALKGVHPEPLTPGTAYRLILSTGGKTAFKDFKTKPVEE